jgi:SAM-dependent methyltransferase
MEKNTLTSYFNEAAKSRDTWRKRNWYYHQELVKFFSFNIPENRSILEIGCGTGDLLSQLKPKEGLGLDISPEMIKIASSKHGEIKYLVGDIEDLTLQQKFEYIIMQDTIGHLSDVWLAFRNLHKVTDLDTRIVITTYNHLWEPLILFAEKIGLKMKQPYQNWLSIDDIENILYLNNYEVVKKGYRFLFPFFIPFISNFINKYMAKLPLIRKLCLVGFVIAKEKGTEIKYKDYPCSVIIPCRNEEGNIKSAISRMPELGLEMEIIFVDGNSTDDTVAKIKEMQVQYKEKNIKLIHQGEALGKGDAVRKGFDVATGDILMILDADLTVPPEDLPKFYLALVEQKGEFINGSRLVYPMEKQAMRTLNILGNKVFSLLFTWILEQRIKDTLCGTKVLFRENYLRIKEGRKYFGEFDPFGDFDLLFGAAKLNLKIVEVPVRYKERTYGTTKISRFTHGWLLLRMCWIAFKKIRLQ